MKNSDMIKRIRKAAGYQKQAIRALFPEGMDEHLDVIEKELKSMFTEIIAGAMSECVKNRCDNDQDEDPKSGVRKVDID